MKQTKKQINPQNYTELSVMLFISQREYDHIPPSLSTIILYKIRFQQRGIRSLASCSNCTACWRIFTVHISAVSEKVIEV